MGVGPCGLVSRPLWPFPARLLGISPMAGRGRKTDGQEFRRRGRSGVGHRVAPVLFVWGFVGVVEGVGEDHRLS